MPLQVVVGAGPTGVATATLLAERGDQVRLVSRSGTSSPVQGVEAVAADATDSKQVAELARGAQTLFNCAMPRYDSWPQLFPPINNALLSAAAEVGSDYVLVGNAYGYPPATGPITESMPLAPTTRKGRVRAQMWEEALGAHQAGRVRVTELRSSDYVGAGAISIFTLTAAPQILQGETATIPMELDVAHTWTTTDDVARALVAITENDISWGRAWHTPAVAPLSVRELSARFATVAGVEGYGLVSMSLEMLEEIGRSDSIVAELVEMSYLHRRPFVLDSTETEAVFGIRPGDFDESLRAMADQLSTVVAS